jgi:SAM-dependent MidA family methyltransferase
MTEHNEALKQAIVNRIQEKGKIIFAEFMNLALYHPEYGYYVSDFPKIGKEGDYYTSSDVHSIFGQLIAKQLRQMWERLARPDEFTVIEMGAGKGLLCYDILESAQTAAPAFFQSLRYILLETSRYHVERQTELLGAFIEQGRVHWLTWENLRTMRITGCILSNEFFDALPVHIVVNQKERLKEVYVGYAPGGLVEVIDALSTPRLADYFHDLGVTLGEGQRAEVSLKALEWLEAIYGLLDEGFVMTIDYGFLADELYAPHRARGTLLCYHKHTVNENPFSHLGHQDITAHVNFSSLMRKGEALGLKTIGFTTQTNFLLALGLADAIVEMEKKETSPVKRLKSKLALKNLILPGSMGEVFKVLIQYQGAENPSLDGLGQF